MLRIVPQRPRSALALALLLVALANPGAHPDDAVRVTSAAELQRLIDGAAEGDTLVLAAGEYRGPVTVSRRVTIRGPGAVRIVGSGHGSVLTLQADGIVVEHLEIRGSGRNLSTDDAGILVTGDSVRITGVRLRDNLHGVYVRGGKGARLVGNHVIGLGARDDPPPVVDAGVPWNEEGPHHAAPGARALMGNGLHLWNANGAFVENNHVQDVRDGIYVSHTHRAVFRRNRVHDSRYAIHYMYSSDNVVSGNELWGNVAGAALMFSRNLEVSDNIFRDHSGSRAYGLLLQNVDGSLIERNTLRANRAGLRMQNSSANRFSGNRVVGNLVGMTINSSSRDNVFTRNHVGPNLKQLVLTGPAPPSRWSVDRVGNRWHGALPLDLTGDGISEWPHHVVDVMAGRAEDSPHLQLLIGSPGIRVLEWALSRAPVPGMRHITDPHPLTR
jgi:nitrous oxidase accessory protein